MSCTRLARRGLGLLGHRRLLAHIKRRGIFPELPRTAHTQLLVATMPIGCDGCLGNSQFGRDGNHGGTHSRPSEHGSLAFGQGDHCRFGKTLPHAPLSGIAGGIPFPFRILPVHQRTSLPLPPFSSPPHPHQLDKREYDHKHQKEAIEGGVRKAGVQEVRAILAHEAPECQKRHMTREQRRDIPSRATPHLPPPSTKQGERKHRSTQSACGKSRIKAQCDRNKNACRRPDSPNAEQANQPSA